MDEIWTIERALWLEGAEAYQSRMADQCLMAFGPMGVLRDAEIPESLREAPRWSDVQMANRTAIAPHPDIAILAYEATGQRSGAEPYRALCTSTYIRKDDGWRIAQHQQTPL